MVEDCVTVVPIIPHAIASLDTAVTIAPFLRATGTILLIPVFAMEQEHV